jgi:copper chaperone CopZ
VRRALQSVPGVRTVEIDFQAQTARVGHDGQATPEALTAALEKAGYKVFSIE